MILSYVNMLAAPFSLQANKFQPLSHTINLVFDYMQDEDTDTWTYIDPGGLG